MKAIQILKPGEIHIASIPEPKTTAGEVLLKINRIGLCGSDMSTWLGKNPLVQYPRIPGHEIAATIVGMGSGVPDDFREGQQVTVVPYTSCGHCTACRNGRPNACRYNQTLGVQRDGALTEYISVPWTKIISSTGLSQEELALTEPLTVGFHAIGRGMVTDIDTVMVLGCGMIGAGAVIRSAQRGAKVIAVDIDGEKLELAQRLGAQVTINSRDSDLSARLEELTGGEGPTVVIEAAGNPVTTRIALEEVAFTGRVILIGYVKDDVLLQTPLAVKKEVDIQGSRNASPSDFEAVVRYLESGKCPVDRLVSNKVSMDEVGDALKFWSENPGKVQKILVEVS